MLFKQPILEKIAQGQVTVAYRRWKRPTVKKGGSLRTPVGVLAITSVEAIDESVINQRAAKQAGFDSFAELQKELRTRDDSQLYRIRFRMAGDDPRIELRNKSRLSQEELDDISSALQRMDKRSKAGPWTLKTLKLIDANPETRAPDLAASIGQEAVVFKRNVRKLKELGLTESMGVGYRISPRGRTLLKRLTKQ